MLPPPTLQPERFRGLDAPRQGRPSSAGGGVHAVLRGAMLFFRGGSGASVSGGLRRRGCVLRKSSPSAGGWGRWAPPRPPSRLARPLPAPRARGSAPPPGSPAKSCRTGAAAVSPPRGGRGEGREHPLCTRVPLTELPPYFGGRGGCERQSPRPPRGPGAPPLARAAPTFFTNVAPSMPTPLPRGCPPCSTSSRRFGFPPQATPGGEERMGCVTLTLSLPYSREQTNKQNGPTARPLPPLPSRPPARITHHHYW